MWLTKSMLFRQFALLLLLAAFVLGPSHVVVAQQDQELYRFNYRVNFNSQDDLVPERLNLTCQFYITTARSIVPLSVVIPVSKSGQSTGNVNVTLDMNPTDVILASIGSDVSLLLGRQNAFYPEARERNFVIQWEVESIGNRFVYTPLAIPSPYMAYMYSNLATDLRIRPTGYFGRSIEVGTRSINVYISLSARAGDKYACDPLGLEDLKYSISFNEPGPIILSRDLSFVIVDARNSTVHIRASYMQSVPALPNQKWIELPFEFDIELEEGRPLALGSRLLSSLEAASMDWLMRESEFLNKSRAVVPDIAAKISQAKEDISSFELAFIDDPASANSFALQRGLKLLAEADDQLAILSSTLSLFVTPAILSLLLILGAILSHLFLNGNKVATLAIAGFASLLAAELHPGLRVFLISLRPDFTTLVTAAMPVLSLLFTGFLIFRGSGPRSQVGLAISTAIRMTKTRKLRGLLTVLAVAVVASAAVPSITVKTVMPVRIQVLETQYEGSLLLSVSNSWRMRMATQGGAASEESGFSSMSSSEPSFYAMTLGFRESTPISLVFYRSSKASGCVIFANLTFLAKYLGLAPRGVNITKVSQAIIVNSRLDTIRQGETLVVAGVPLKVIGFFDSSSLTDLTGRPLEELIEGNELLFQNPTWDSLTSPASSPFGRSVLDQLIAERAPFLLSTKYALPPQIVGVVDINMISGINKRNLVTISVVGTLGSEVDEAKLEGTVRGLISSTKNSLSMVDSEQGISVEFISSISTTISANGQSKQLEIDFPVVLPLGSWTSQLILMSIGGLIIYTVILGSTVERAKESATISSLGASPNFITFSFLAEGLMLGAIGAVIGFSAGYILAIAIGTSSPDVATEFHTLTPMLLVLSTSIVITGLASISPARNAIMKVVPSRKMLTRGIGEIRIDNTGARRIYVPLRLREGQVTPFLDFISRRLGTSSYYEYGMRINEYQIDDLGHRFKVSYTGAGGITDRVANYDMKVALVPVGDYLHVELVARADDGKWTKLHDSFLKEMVYSIRDEILKFTVPT